MLLGDDRDQQRRLRDLDGDGEDDSGSELIIWAAAGLAAALLTFWLAVQLAALLDGIVSWPPQLGWLPLAAGLQALPEVMIALVQAPLATQNAWPAELRADAPHWYFLWPTLLVCGWGTVRVVLRLRDWRSGRSKRDWATSWATQRDLKPLLGKQPNPLLRLLRRSPAKPQRGVILGRSERGSLLRLEPQTHGLIVAGTASGKTAGLCAPALLTFEGAVIATSVKFDLIEHTIKRRQQLGDVYVFDPVGALAKEHPDLAIAGWTPLESARDWRGAQRTAGALIEVAMNKKGGGGSNMEFWKRMSQQTLPVMLYAAAVMDEDMRRVVRWLFHINEPQTHVEVDSILNWRLECGDEQAAKAMDAWAGFVTKDQKMRGDIAATIASALVSYEDPKVQENALRCDILPEKFFNGKANTIYVVAPMSEQARLEPVFVTMMQSLLLWVSDQPRPLQKDLLCVLDEAANIAALPLLPELLSTIRSQNVQILTAWQDFAQINARYGDQKNTILNNSMAKLVLPGVSDPETIRYFTEITGETVEDQVSVSRSEESKRRRQVSVGESRRSLITPAVIRQQRLGQAILVYKSLPPAKVKLRLFFKDPELRRLSKGDTRPPGLGERLRARLGR